MGDLGSVFVVGGCGLLEHHIFRCLLESGDAISIIVFDISTKNNRYSDPKVEYIIGSITSKEEVLSALKKTKATVIINTASPDPKVPVSRLLEKVNITGTQNLLDSIAQKSYDDIIFANETWALPENPVDGAAYPRTKKVGESLVLNANGQNGLLTVAIRLCTLFGEGDLALIKSMIEIVQDGRVKYHNGTGKNLYDFIYAAEAQILAAKRLLKASRAKETIPQELRVDGEAFFIPNNEP